MKYVIDASTAFEWKVPEPDSVKPIRLREDYRATHAKPRAFALQTHVGALETPWRCAGLIC
jgi:hypothetical protein